MLYSQKVAPYVFVLPFVISLLVFWLYPLISGIVMSFQDISFGGSQWVGLKHYQKLASDKFFKTAVFNSVEYMLLTLLLLIPIPMMLAVLMESRLTKAKGVWKVIMYIPALTSVVISGMLFRLMFSEGDNGQMNQLMHFPSTVLMVSLMPKCPTFRLINLKRCACRVVRFSKISMETVSLIRKI